MAGTIGNINVRIGADASALTDEMKKCQNTILTFRDESLTALKSFGLPNISSANLVEAIQSGQRVVADFVQESGESLSEFQQRVRNVFEQAGIDITAYEDALTKADNVHAEFAKGAIKNFQAAASETETYVSSTQQRFENLKATLTGAFSAIGDSSVSMAGKLAAAGDIINTALPELFALGLAFMFADKIYNAGKSVMDFAAQTQDVEAQFENSMGSMYNAADRFTQKLSQTYGITQETLKGMMSKEYQNTRMLGFDPTQAEQMSERVTQLSYDLGKLRGVDPSQVFNSLQIGLEGRTTGLRQLGIDISTTDLKNRALSEGIIKQGQTMTTAQTALMAYQEILEKTSQETGYYATQADTLSNRQAKVAADWDQMKRNLSEALIPALTALKGVLVDVEEAFIAVGNAAATAIRAVTLFAEDAYSAIEDLFALNFSDIGQQWADNYNSVYNYASGTQTASSAMDQATDSANAQNNAQKKLGNTLKNNIMSFDQLHNITKDSGGGGGSSGTPGNGGGINPPNAPNITANELKNGITIPIKFGPVPPVPPLPPVPSPPPVLENWCAAAAVALAAWAATTTAELGGWETATELGLAAWSILTTSILTTWAGVTEAALASWATATEAVFTGWSVAIDLILSPWALAAEAVILAWSLATNAKFQAWAAKGIAVVTSWAGQFQSEFALALNDTESLVEGWGTAVSHGFSSVMDGAISDIKSLTNFAGQALSSLGTWFNNNKSWLGPLAAGGAVVAGTAATGGLDLIPAGIAAAGEGLSSLGSSIAAAVPAFASGGIVNSPRIALIGEAGPEAVIPLSQFGSVMGSYTSSMNMNTVDSSQSTQPINVTIKLDGRTLAKAMYAYTTNESDRQGRTIGYNSSYNLPK